MPSDKFVHATILLLPEDHVRLCSEAAAREISNSELVRLALADYLAKRDRELERVARRPRRKICM